MEQNQYFIEYLDNGQIKEEPFKNGSSALRQASILIDAGRAVYSVFQIKTENNKTNKNILVHFFDKSDQTISGITYSNFRSFIKDGKLFMSRDRILTRYQGCFELCYPSNKMLRFPSLPDLFLYITNFGKLYNFHDFNYSVEISREKQQEIYIDDNFIIAHSKEDIFYMNKLSENLEPKKEDERKIDYSKDALAREKENEKSLDISM